MKRILLKISWEALSSEVSSIDAKSVAALAANICKIQDLWIELVLVLGGGNIYRWSQLIASGVDPADSHNMSMLSTVFNALTLKNFLQRLGMSAVVMDALHVEFLEKYTATKAREYISEGKVIIASSWWWNPFFTTDTTWVLRALETHCDAVVKLTKVDWVYDSDPMKNPEAKKFDSLSYNDFIKKNLKVLDQTAIILARDNTLPIYVSNLNNFDDLISIIEGRSAGTKIS